MYFPRAKVLFLIWSLIIYYFCVMLKSCPIEAWLWIITSKIVLIKVFGKYSTNMSTISRINRLLALRSVFAQGIKVSQRQNVLHQKLMVQSRTGRINVKKVLCPFSFLFYFSPFISFSSLQYRNFASRRLPQYYQRYRKTCW